MLLVGAWMGEAAAQSLFGDRLFFRNPQRLLALLLVVLGHSVLIYLIAMHGHSARTVVVDEVPSIPIYLTPLMEVEQEAPRKADVADHTTSKKPLRKESISITLPVKQPTQIAEISRQDWASEAQEAARRMANSVAPRRGFGKPPEEDVVIDKPPVGIFERGSAHRAGDIEMIGPGIERRWYSDRCFQEYGHLPDLFPAPGLRINPVRCTRGPRNADGTLFEHLTPEYLKQKK
jgi:hypothetical protein